jgi:hypothetical protein
LGFPLQASPAVQDAHEPPLQTWFVPHVVPFATSPVSTHTGAPLAHWIAPVLQSDGVQAAPSVQAMQPPVPLHT